MVLKKYCVADPINISNGSATSIKHLVEIIRDFFELNSTIYYDESKPTAVPYRVLDNTKFETLIGKLQRTPLTTGISRTIDWYNSSLTRD